MFLPIVTSQNGYVAGLVFLPLFFLLAITCLVLFIIGFAFLFRENTVGLYFLFAMLALPAGFFGSAVTSKQLEIGAYREEPMSPIAAPVGNKVLFKTEATHDEIERFWNEIIGYPTDDKGGTWSRPGVGGGFRPGPEGEHEVIVFSFAPDATEEEKNDIRERIRNYSPVHEYLENVDTSPVPNQPSPTVPSRIESQLRSRARIQIAISEVQTS